jgi:hypothetical protein
MFFDCSGLFSCQFYHSTSGRSISNTICHFRFYDICHMPPMHRSAREARIMSGRRGRIFTSRDLAFPCAHIGAHHAGAQGKDLHNHQPGFLLRPSRRSSRRGTGERSAHPAARISPAPRQTRDLKKIGAWGKPQAPANHIWSFRITPEISRAFLLRDAQTGYCTSQRTHRLLPAAPRACPAPRYRHAACTGSSQHCGWWKAGGR